jgi:hypothetical protein
MTDATAARPNAAQCVLDVTCSRRTRLITYYDELHAREIGPNAALRQLGPTAMGSRERGTW